MTFIVSLKPNWVKIKQNKEGKFKKNTKKISGKKWFSYKKKRVRRVPEVKTELPIFHFYYYLRVK